MKKNHQRNKFPLNVEATKNGAQTKFVRASSAGDPYALPLFRALISPHRRSIYLDNPLAVDFDYSGKAGDQEQSQIEFDSLRLGVPLKIFF